MFLLLSIEQNEVPLDAQLNGLVASTPLGEYIKSEVFISDLKERVSLYQLYLSDFISSVYRTTRNSEFKVINMCNDKLFYVFYNIVSLSGN